MNLTESSKSPAGVAQGNKQWGGLKQFKTRYSEISGYRVFMTVWQKNKPPARQVEGVALASSKKPPVII